MDSGDEEALKALEQDKERMVRHYLSLQDRADSVNKNIYEVCCGIEALNVRISEARARLDILSKAPASPTNGKAHPRNGKSDRSA